MAEQPSAEISALNIATLRAHEDQIKKLKINLAKIGKSRGLCRREKKVLTNVIIALRKEVRSFQTIVNKTNRLLRTANVPVMGIATEKPTKVIMRKPNVVKGV